MKFIFSKMTLLVLVALLCSEALAISTSASYKITAKTLSVGAALGTSASYKLRGRVGGFKWEEPYSASYKIGEGFLKQVYFAPVILGPLVTSTAAQAVVDNQTLPVVIYGANFVDGATVVLTREGETSITGSKVSVVSSAQITCEFNISGAKAGLWDVTVTNPDGRFGSLPSAIKIYAWPKVASIKPGKAYNNVNKPTAVEIGGENFREGASVSLLKTGEEDIIGSSISVVSATKITCNFDLYEKSTGRWDVKVENENKQSATLTEGFKVEKEEFEITKPVKIEKPAAAPGMTEAETPIAAASIKYELSQDAQIMIQVFNMRGEMLWSETLPMGAEGGQAGENTVIWNGITSFGSKAGAGVYFIRIYRIENGKKKFIKQMKYGVIRQ